MNILSSDPCTASDQNSTSGNSCISLGRQILPSSQLWSLCVSCLQLNIVRNLCIQMAIEDSGSAACHWIAWLLLATAAAAWNRKLLGSWLPIISGRGWGGGGLDINPQHLLRILHQIALFLFQKAHRLSQWWAQFENRRRAARLTITASCGREVCSDHESVEVQIAAAVRRGKGWRGCASKCPSTGTRLSRWVQIHVNCCWSEKRSQICEKNICTEPQSASLGENPMCCGKRNDATTAIVVKVEDRAGKALRNKK